MASRSSIMAKTLALAILSSLSFFQWACFLQVVEANPKSRPYVAYRGNPFDQEIVTRRILEDGLELRGTGGGGSSSSRVLKNQINRESIKTKDKTYEDDPRCPLSFRLGTTHSTHLGSSSSSSGTHTPPIIYPLHPDFDAGSGRQILLTTDYEVLEMWTPSNAIGTHQFEFRDDGKEDAAGAGRGLEGPSTEQLKEDEQFPLLFESSSFYHSSPIVHDVEGDGVADALLGDYDGNLHFVGLDFEQPQSNRGSGDSVHSNNQRRRRYYKRISIPRLFVRKSWYEVAINRTKEDESMALVDESEAAKRNHTKWEEFEPYHTYFAGISDTAWRGPHDEDALRGVTGDVLHMDVDLSKKLVDRKKKQKLEGDRVDSSHRRLVEGGVIDESNANMVKNEEHFVDRGSDLPVSQSDLQPEDAAETRSNLIDEYMYEAEPELFGDDSMDAPPDGSEATENDPIGTFGDDHFPSHQEGKEDGDSSIEQGMDDYYARRRFDYQDDMYRPQAPDGYDSYEQYQEVQNRYYHDSNYLRLPPHLLSTCTLAELPRQYSTGASNPIDRIDELLLCAVSYYFDEDECKDPTKGGKSFGKHANADGGDETEELRGRYVANAILGYNLRWKYWSVQEVLDLSTDWSSPLGDIVKGGTAPTTSNAYAGMGAFALASPIAVNLDGGDKHHIMVGTSMGLVYALEVTWHSSRKGWPVQMRHPVEQRVLVEDVVDNTNLEVFVIDTGGDIVSLSADGEVLWARNLLRDDEADPAQNEVNVVRGTSPMTLGDVEGTGDLAIVLLAKVATTDRQHVDRPEHHKVFEYRLYAIDAVTSDDLPHFPISLGSGASVQSSHSMPQPLLIDLHEDQRHWLDQIHGLSDEDKEAIKSINRNAARQEDGSTPRAHGGNGRGLHIVQPLGQDLHIIEGATSCSQVIDVGDNLPSMVMADDVHGTGGLDLVVTSAKGEILTLESDVVPYHPLNVWSAGVSRSPGSNAQSHGFSSKQGIFVHHISRQFRDILGIYIPVTFEIFDRRPNIENEKNRQLYQVDIRAGMSAKRTIMSYTYNTTGVYTERVQIPFGPGYYSISVRLRTTHGLVYEDTFHVGFNVNYMGGLWLIVCMPLVIATVLVLMKVRTPNWEEDEDYGGRGVGILGRTPPP
ncbi:hypothetical protein HJC23_001476 [Cyclotella cryptica]|uniref:DEX1 C-terminal domain-containing protein n=1 Tax=Cyclotella cryptica TaxID=29204 RepID=A0ABD3NY32_9STRA